MAKTNEESKPKRLSLKKTLAGEASSPARAVPRGRPRPWPSQPKIKPEVVTLNGIVTSADGVPIPKIGISIEGIDQTVSDKCGIFKIKFPPDFNAILIFTWQEGTAKINIEKLKKIPNIIISLKAIPSYVNKVCDKNYKREKRIRI